jgi:DNA-binding NarL/FixJ family response regulator
MERIENRQNQEKEDNNTINIVLVDDHQMLIDGIKALLKKEKNMVFVGTANNGNDALKLIEQLNPNLVITDINMPEMSGIELTKIIKKNFPETKVLVLTMFNEKAIISEILASEAEGYILKNTGREELVRAINKIAHNGTFFSSEVIETLMKEVKKEKKKEKEEAQLTPREIEIVKLIVEEFSTVEIAEKLFISPRTVDTHRKHILEKTQSKTVVGLIKYAFEYHLV